MSWDDPARYDVDIARALRTPSGHLSIGRGGFLLHYEHARLSGHDCDVIKDAAVAAGLPVIDSRMLPFDGMFDAMPPGRAANVIDFWLRYVRAHGA